MALGAAPAFWGRWRPVAARAQHQRSAARIGVLLVGLSIIYRVIYAALRPLELDLWKGRPHHPRCGDGPYYPPS